jgi:hypothetical protein
VVAGSAIFASAALAFWLWPLDGHRSADRAAAARTVLVAADGRALPETAFFARRDCLGNPTTCVNGAGGVVLTYRMAGRAPPRPRAATVLTDENCEPDRNGIAHCLNRLELDGGARLVVRHDHNMGNDPCLAPGERVVVEQLA